MMVVGGRLLGEGRVKEFKLMVYGFVGWAILNAIVWCGLAIVSGAFLHSFCALLTKTNF